MAQASLDYLNRYTERKHYLRMSGDRLLERIRSLEIGMNRRLQRHEASHPEEVIKMQFMIAELLSMLAEIKTCDHLKMSFQLVAFSDEYYRKLHEIFFNNLLYRFNSELANLNSNKIHFIIH